MGLRWWFSQIVFFNYAGWAGWYVGASYACTDQYHVSSFIAVAACELRSSETDNYRLLAFMGGKF
jgi:hypothetical protein